MELVESTNRQNRFFLPINASSSRHNVRTPLLGPFNISSDLEEEISNDLFLSSSRNLRLRGLVRCRYGVIPPASDADVADTGKQLIKQIQNPVKY